LHSPLTAQNGVCIMTAAGFRNSFQYTGRRLREVSEPNRTSFIWRVTHYPIVLGAQSIGIRFVYCAIIARL
jgi:hypothetical protein